MWVSEEPFHWDAFAILGSLAQATSRIRLGPGVTSPYLRPPHLQAMSIATLDRLSGGRAFMGLGRGLTQWYRHLLGIDVGRPVEAMEEAIALLRGWWQEPYEASSPGGHFGVQGLRREAGGIQPYLPIYLAAVGPSMVRLAARGADGVVFYWPSSEFLEKVIPLVKKEGAAAGRDMSSFAFVVQTGLRVTEDAEAALEELKGRMAVIYSIPGLDNALVSSRHDVSRVVAGLRELMRSGEVLNKGGWLREFDQLSDLEAGRRAIPSDLAAEVAVVGDSAAVRKRLARYQALGVTHVFAPLPQGNAVEYKALLGDINPNPGIF